MQAQPSAPDLFTQNWKKAQRFQERHIESQETKPWFSGDTWKALGHFAEAIGRVSLATQRTNQTTQVGFVNKKTTIHVHSRNTKEEQETSDRRVGAAVAGAAAGIGTFLSTMFIGRINKIDEEIGKLTRLKALEGNDFRDNSKHPAVVQLRKAMESKYDGLQTERKFTIAKLVVTIAVVASSIFAVCAFFLAQPMAIPAICLSLSLLAGIAVKGAEYFISDIDKKNRKTTGYLKNLEALHDAHANTWTVHAPSQEAKMPEQIINLQASAPPMDDYPRIYLENRTMYVENGTYYSADGRAYFNGTTQRWTTLDSQWYLNQYTGQWEPTLEY